MTMHGRIGIVLLSTVLSLGAGGVQAAGATPPKVLGCDIGPDVQALIQCVSQASSSAVARATAALDSTIDDLEQQIETLQSSPLLALPAEQIQSLTQCLAQAGLNMSQVAGSAAADPVQFARARLDELMAASVAQAGAVLGPALAPLAAGTPPSDDPQTMAAYADKAYAAMVQMAEQDPVARCALPMMTALQPQIRQAAIGTYQQAMSTAQTLVEQTVAPVLDQALAAALGGMFQSMRTGPMPARVEAPPGRRTAPRQQPTGPMPREDSGRSAASADKGPDRSQMRQQDPGKAGAKPAPRTRSIAAGARSAVASAVPDDVQRIALAVFTERMLDPGRIKALTQEVNGLSAALANGSGGSVDLTNLDKLINELSAPPAQLAVELGIETARYYGHWVLDTLGGPIVDAGLGTVSAADAVAKEISAVICAIGHIPAEGGCAMVRGVASMLYLQIGVPLIKQGLMAGGHVQYEAAVACAAQAIRAGQNPAQIPAANCSALGGVARLFPTGEELAAFALPQVEAPRMALLSYQQAVRNLATVSRNTATGR